MVIEGLGASTGMAFKAIQPHNENTYLDERLELLLQIQENLATFGVRHIEVVLGNEQYLSDENLNRLDVVVSKHQEKVARLSWSIHLPPINSGTPEEILQKIRELQGKLGVKLLVCHPNGGNDVSRVIEY